MKRSYGKLHCIFTCTFLLIVFITVSACSDAAKNTTNPDSSSLFPPTFVTDTGEDEPGPLTFNLVENTQASTNVDLLAKDKDGDAISWKISSAPTKGTVVIGSNSLPTSSKIINYLPQVDAIGTDTFVVTIDDGTGVSDSIAVNVNIVPLDQFISVNVSGYTTGNTIVLQLNGKNNLSITNDGIYIFSDLLKAELIESDNQGFASFTQISMNSAGGIAVWEQRDVTRSNIWANTFDSATKSWGTAEMIETNNLGNAFRPQIALDSGGQGISV